MNAPATHVPPSPASNLQIPRPWLPPGHPTSLPEPPHPRFPGRRSRGNGVQRGHQWEPCPPCQPPPPPPATARRPLSCPLFPAARDFCGVMVTWRFRHGVFQAPCQGPETPPLWASLWVAGCQPNPEPLSPAGPRACQAAQLRVAEPLASTLPASQLLWFYIRDCFLGSSHSYILASSACHHLLLPPETL